MTEWTFVKMTEARQVVALMGVREAKLPHEEIAPTAHYTALKEGGEQASAVDFLAHALPRFEGVAWAARVLDDQSRVRQVPVRDRLALDHSLRWLGDPDEAGRRATYAASDQAESDSAERMLGMAVFFSGGNISMPDLQPVLPPPEASARFVATAIKIAAYRTDDPDAVLNAALTLGEAVASGGVGALAPA